MPEILYNYPYQEVLDKQSKASPQIYRGGWVNATASEVDKYLNPNNSISGDALFQHMLLTYQRVIPGITASLINKELKGVLKGHGEAFIKAGIKYNVHPVYLAIHSVIESGNGSSKLATGSVPGYSGYYNVFGVGAYDKSADPSGAAYAKKSGWNTVEKAIHGAAEFISRTYISKGQDTLYRMRWNPASPATHQYATDIAWANSIASRVAKIMNTINLSNVSVSTSVYLDTASRVVLESKGSKLVEEAKKHLGKPYVWGGNGPNGFDCSGFVKYVYKQAIDYNMPYRVARDQYKLGRETQDTMRAGDLLFFVDTYDTGSTPNISHVGMALGEGDQFIQASGKKVNINTLSDPYWKKHYYGRKRILSDEETATGESVGGFHTNSPIDSLTGLAGGLPLTQVSEYKERLEDALFQLNKAENKHCSIVDLKYGGEFKFYAPETLSESLPVSWDNSASVRGRSVPVVGYSSTGPRSISFEVIVAAGAGYYTGPDAIDRMYKDIRFLQSLVYPDYSKALLETPPVVLLSVGSNIRLKGVINSLNINYEGAHDSSNRYMKAILSISVSQVSDEPPGLLDMRAGNTRSY